jgi:DMSO reductase anchor subunit/ferredoxin
VLAYDKDPRTGIVRHLDDQCIGCSYCTLMCPYEVPQYSKRLGIVRKCDLCQGRLAVGEAPACAQACPGDAIRVSVVDTEEVRSRLATVSLPQNASVTNAFLPDSPDPAISLPTTRYRSNRLLGPDLRSATAGTPEPAPAHAPLGVMLVLTQFALGAFIVDGFQRWQAPPTPGAFLALAGTVLLGLGLAASTSHLGRPAQAWRSFLGWRTSWLSREIIALNVFLFAAVSHTAGVLTRGSWPGLPTAPATGLATVLAGLLGVYTSARVYTATRRGFWSPDRVFPDFLGTVVLASLGFALTQRTDAAASIALAVALPAKVAFELLPLATSLRWRKENSARSEIAPPQPCSAAWIQRSAALLRGPLRPLLVARIAFAGIALTTLLVRWIASDSSVWAWMTLIPLLAGELLSRRLFFRAAVPDRMPGVA